MFTWLAKRPGAVLVTGLVLFIALLAAAFFTGKWHWFSRGGAMLALSGFIVSVRDALLYRPATSYVETSTPPAAAMYRTNRFGVPVFHPDSFPPFGRDPELTTEEIEAEHAKQLDAWEDADPVVVETEINDPGQPMRDFSQMSAEELRQLNVASAFGIVGTFVWAFGDLVGGAP